MPNSVLAVKPETLLVDLPPVPDWFRRELSLVGQKYGKPMFKLVDGQRELKWRNGKMDVKHLLQHQDIPAYVPVIRQVFRRRKDNGDYKLYPSWQAAEADQAEGLDKDIEYTNHLSTRAVGQACWIVEVLVDPDELGGYETWEANRYADLQVNGVFQKVDVMGPFPQDGYYMYCFPVLDEEGNAASPNQRTIDECKRRWRAVQGDARDLEQSIKDYEERIAAFERKQVERIADNIYQFHAGPGMRRFYHGAVGYGPEKVMEGTDFYKSKRQARRDRHK